MMDSFFDIPGLDPTDAFSSAFADDLLGGDVFGLNGGIGGGSLLGLDMDMMDPFGGPGSSSSSLLSDVFNSPTSTTSGSDYGSSMSSFSAATMEDTLCEADLFQSFASAKNFAARNKVRLNNAMKVRNGGGGAVRNTHNNSHHTHNNNTCKKYGKHGGSRPTISMGGNNNGGGGGSSVHPKVYISTFSHNKRNGGGGGGSSAGSGTSILLKSKRGNGGSGGSRNGRGGGGGSSLISSKMSTTISSHHHQPRRSGMYGHVQQQQHQQQQYQQRQPKQIPKTIKFNRSAAGSGSSSSYQLPGSSSISKGNVFPQKNGSCKGKNSSSHSSINNNGRNNNNGSAANRSSFQAAAAAAAQVQQNKVVPIPNPSADHDYCVVYTEAMFATTSSNNSSDHLNSNLDDLLISSISSSQSSNSCPNVDSFLNDHLFSLGSPSAMLNDTIVNSIDGSGGSGGDSIHQKKGQQSSTEVANDLEDLLGGFIPDDVLLNELPNCLQDLFDLDLNSLMDVKSEDVLDGLNDVCNLMTDNYMDDLEELYCSTFDTSSFPTPAPTPASSPAPPPLMMTHLQTPNACTSSTSSSSTVNSIANNNSLPKLMSEEGVEGEEEEEEEEACDDESTLLVIPKDHDEHDANSWQDIAPHTPPTTASCLQY